MPTKDDTPVPTIVHSEDGRFVHYGFTHDGAFHPIASEGSGDYQERIKAAKEEE